MSDHQKSRDPDETRPYDRGRTVEVPLEMLGDAARSEVRASIDRTGVQNRFNTTHSRQLSRSEILALHRDRFERGQFLALEAYTNLMGITGVEIERFRPEGSLLRYDGDLVFRGLEQSPPCGFSAENIRIEQGRGLRWLNMMPLAADGAVRVEHCHTLTDMADVTTFDLELVDVPALQRIGARSVITRSIMIDGKVQESLLRQLFTLRSTIVDAAGRPIPRPFSARR